MVEVVRKNGAVPARIRVIDRFVKDGRMGYSLDPFAWVVIINGEGGDVLGMVRDQDLCKAASLLSLFLQRTDLYGTMAVGDGLDVEFFVSQAEQLVVDG